MKVIIDSEMSFHRLCSRTQHGLTSPLQPTERLLYQFFLPLNVPVASLKVPAMPEAAE